MSFAKRVYTIILMKEKYLKQIRNILYFLLTVTLMGICKITSSVSINLIMSMFIFLIMLPVVSALERHKVPGGLATLISALIAVMVVSAAVGFIFYTVNQLINILPGYVVRLNYLDSYLMGIISRVRGVPHQDSLIKFLNIDWATSLMPLLRSVSSSAINIIKNSLIILLLAMFLMMERHTLIPKLSSVTQNSENPEKVAIMMDRVNRQVSKYLGMKLLLSTITGLLFYATGLAVGLDLAFLWGVLAVILNFIPTFGSIIITLITIFMAVLQFLPDWTPVIIVAAGTIATQMIIGNILDPRLQGNQLNLSPFFILASLSIFGYIWGIIGMFLAVPIMSIMQIIFANMDSTRGIAILVSSGSSLRKRMKAERKSLEPGLFDDVMFPQESLKKTPKKP